MDQAKKSIVIRRKNKQASKALANPMDQFASANPENTQKNPVDQGHSDLSAQFFLNQAKDVIE